MTAPDQFAAARQRIAAQIDRDTDNAKEVTRAEFKRLGEWMNRSMGQRVRRAMVMGGR